MTETAIDDHLPVGTVLNVGHPNNNLLWFRTARGWIDTAGRPVDRSSLNFYDTIGHGAYVILHTPRVLKQP